MYLFFSNSFFFQAEDGIRDRSPSRGLGDVYKRQEYVPAENAWIPIEADGYIYINCLWIAGAMKGHGYSNDLLSECILSLIHI